MMRADVLNLHIYHVRTEITDKKHIPTLHVCFTDKSELKEFLVGETLSQVCSMEKDESEYVHKNINKQKDTNNNIDYE